MQYLSQIFYIHIKYPQYLQMINIYSIFKYSKYLTNSMINNLVLDTCCASICIDYVSTTAHIFEITLKFYLFIFNGLRKLIYNSCSYTNYTYIIVNCAVQIIHNILLLTIIIYHKNTYSNNICLIYVVYCKCLYANLLTCVFLLFIYG